MQVQVLSVARHHAARTAEKPQEARTAAPKSRGLPIELPKCDACEELETNTRLQTCNGFSCPSNQRRMVGLLLLASNFDGAASVASEHLLLVRSPEGQGACAYVRCALCQVLCTIWRQ